MSLACFDPNSMFTIMYRATLMFIRITLQMLCINVFRLYITLIHEIHSLSNLNISLFNYKSDKPFIILQLVCMLLNLEGNIHCLSANLFDVWSRR